VDKAMGFWILGRHRPANLDWTVAMACVAVVAFFFIHGLNTRSNWAVGPSKFCTFLFFAFGEASAQFCAGTDCIAFVSCWMMVHQKKMTQRSGVGSSFLPRIRAMLRLVPIGGELCLGWCQ
jgi:hypothetical protein